mgnify:FL=1
MGKKQEGGDEQPPPFRLNYPLHYVLHAWADYHQHGRWPRPGGFDAQDVALVADFQTITRRFNWHIRQLADQDGGGEHDMSIDAFAGVIGNIQQSDWHAFGGR